MRHSLVDNEHRFFLPIENDEKLAYWLIAFGHVGACLIPNAIYDAKKEQVSGAIIATGVDVVTVVIMAVCFAFDLINIPIAAGLIASKWIMVATCSLSDYLLRYPEIWPSLDRNQSRALWSSARIMSIATTLNVLPISLGALLTRILFGASEAGIFAIAAYVLRTHVRIIGLLNRTVYPHVVGACGETSSFVKRMFVAYGGFTLLLSAAALLCSEIALSFFFPVRTVRRGQRL
ncbi:MAG: hypothetical protein GY904_15725 [Planctomycetaceae bacterium]|nr:hypothetical protein [Planctomycetaceae bacterium]